MAVIAGPWLSRFRSAVPIICIWQVYLYPAGRRIPSTEGKDGETFRWGVSVRFHTQATWGSEWGMRARNSCWKGSENHCPATACRKPSEPPPCFKLLARARLYTAAAWRDSIYGPSEMAVARATNVHREAGPSGTLPPLHLQWITGSWNH